MTTAIAIPSNTASTLLTHFFGRGFSDDSYVVERFKAMVDGDIRRCADEPPAAKKGRRKPKYTTASLNAVRPMRPERNEVIVCTGLKTRGGVAMGLGIDRKQKGRPARFP